MPADEKDAEPATPENVMPLDAEARSEKPASVPPDLDKDKRARLEKFAQAHLDRAQSLSSGATKAALAWAITLVLIWFQVLEHRLTLVFRFHHSQGALISIALSGSEGSKGIGALAAEATETESAAADQLIELPFGVKLLLHPYWVSTLWLALALGLSLYLLDSRRRIFRLTERGITLQREAGVDDPRIQSLVGGGIWWLAPAWSGSKTSRSASLHEAFSWDRPTANATAVVAAAALLLLMQARVQYVSLCVAAGLLGGASNVGLWLAITLFNLSLGAAVVVVIWRWFSFRKDAVLSGNTVPETVTRRRALSLVGGAAFGMLAFLFNSTAVYGFAAARLKRFPRPVTTVARTVGRRRRKKHLKKLSAPARTALPFGLYVNPKSRTVHISAPAPEGHKSRCESCIDPSWQARLKPISASAVHWDHRRPPHSGILVARPGSVAGSAVDKDSPVAVPDILDSGAHPHSLHRTFMVEQQALAYLKADPKLAIQFLTQATKGVPAFGLRTGVRLYDLLAGLAVMYEDQKALDDLVATLNEELRKLGGYNARVYAPFTRAQERFNTFLHLVLVMAGVETGMPSKFSRRRSHPRSHQKPKKKILLLASEPECPGGGTEKPRTRAAHSGKSPQMLADSLQARIEKWQRKDCKWATYWASGAVEWGGIKVPSVPSVHKP